MPVVMKGGTSGNREDADPGMNISFDRQPIVTTEKSAEATKYQSSQSTGNREMANPDVPGSGTPQEGVV